MRVGGQAATGGMGLGLAEVTLNPLGGFEELAGGEGGLAKDDGIEKHILGRKTPRLRLDEG